MSTPRPISKTLLLVNQEGLATTQNTRVLIDAVFPCTIVGLRWELSSGAVFDTPQGLDAYINWAIVLVKQGNTAGELPDSVSVAQDFYTPEQNVLAYGSRGLLFTTAAGPIVWNGSTKTMRKMQVGDKLLFISKIGDSNAVHDNMFGAIQFFCKT